MFQAQILDLPENGVPLDSGLFLGVRHNMAPLWVDGVNVRFNNASIQKSLGYLQAFSSSLTEPVRGCIDQLTSSGQALYYGTATKLYKWNAVVEAEVGTGYTGHTAETVTNPVSQWSFVTWGTEILATNGVNPLQHYAGTSFVDLVGPNFTYAHIIHKWGPYVIAMNTSTGPNVIEWCSDDDITTWTIAADNTAGNHNIRDLESGIVAAADLGNRVGIFAKDSMHILQYTSADFVFGVTRGPAGVGAVSKNSVVSVSNKIFGLGPKGFWVTDGNSAEYIDDPKIKEYYFDNVNQSQLSQVNAYHNERESCVVWHVPSTAGTLDTYYSFDYKRNVWMKGTAPFSACLSSRVFDYPVAFDVNAFTPYFLNLGDDADAVALESSVESKPFDGGDANIEKWFDSLLVMGTTTGILYVSLGFQNDLNDPIEWVTQEFIGDGSPLYYERTARWVRLKLYSTAKDCDWEISQLTLNGTQIGGGLK